MCVIVRQVSFNLRSCISAFVDPLLFKNKDYSVSSSYYYYKLFVNIL